MILATEALTRAPLRFYLGTHRPSWLERTDVPLFVSRVTMPLRKLPRALGPWALDSGAFSEIALHGRWTVEPERYAADVQRYQAEIGNLEWASIQDWMCEPDMLKKTGLTVAEHQRRTVENYLRLRELAPDVPWAPVLQGWTTGEYDDHVAAYERAGVVLEEAPALGIGSVCRRQNTTRIVLMILDLATRFRNLHGFGFKVDGLSSLAHLRREGDPFPLASSDSLAWSYQARREPPLDGCTGHINCANCLPFAFDWRRRLFSSLERAGSVPAGQRSLFG